MSNYVVAIPTYNRPEQVMNKTLTTLLNGNVNKNKIYLFVANKQQLKIYTEIIPPNMYKEIIVGKLGIANQRKFITTYFPEGQYIISIDDDLEDLLFLKGEKLAKIRDLNKFFLNAYKVLKKEKLFIWCLSCQQSFFYERSSTNNNRFEIYYWRDTRIYK